MSPVKSGMGGGGGAGGAGGSLFGGGGDGGGGGNGVNTRLHANHDGDNRHKDRGENGLRRRRFKGKTVGTLTLTMAALPARG